jgi:hypothetical protein
VTRFRKDLLKGLREYGYGSNNGEGERDNERDRVSTSKRPFKCLLTTAYFGGFINHLYHNERETTEEMKMEVGGQRGGTEEWQVVKKERGGAGT